MKSTLFAEGLKFPTGILTWRDGVLVTAAPEILMFKDSDGDGRSDVREVLYSGFFEGNQQLRVNSLRWGLDNWVYCANGAHYGGLRHATKSKSTLTGDLTALGSRDFRFKPDSGNSTPNPARPSTDETRTTGQLVRRAEFLAALALCPAGSLTSAATRTSRRPIRCGRSSPEESASFPRWPARKTLPQLQ